MKLFSFQTMAVVATIVVFNSLQAQEIQGFVYSDLHKPIAGVSIYLHSKKLAETNAEGHFILSEATKLPIALRLEHPLYYISEIEVTENNASFQLSPLSKSEDLEEIRIIAKPQKIPATNTGAEILFPIETVDAEKLNAYSPISLVSAINETPGVFIQSGAISTNRITIRGIGSRTLYGTNKIRAYFDGIPITNGSGETIIDMFDPENLQSLEIIKGPKSTQYGSNLGGTLLLTSKQAEIGKSFASNSLTLGSYGLLKNTVSAGTSSENFSFNINYDH